MAAEGESDERISPWWLVKNPFIQNPNIYITFHFSVGLQRRGRMRVQTEVCMVHCRFIILFVLFGFHMCNIKLFHQRRGDWNPRWRDKIVSHIRPFRGVRQFRGRDISQIRVEIPSWQGHWGREDTVGDMQTRLTFANVKETSRTLFNYWWGSLRWSQKGRCKILEDTRNQKFHFFFP